MKDVFIFLASGFEEVEAVTPIDYLRRAGLNVVTVGLKGKQVTSTRGVTLVCDKTVSEVRNQTPDAVVFPGGMGNAQFASESAAAKAITLRVKDNGGIIAGICAAPALSFSSWGLLDGKCFTCYPGMDKGLPYKAEKNSRVVVDGTLVTACAAGASEEFSFTLVEMLAGKAAVKAVKKSVAAR